MACNKVCFLDQICGFDRLFTETKVRHCHTAGLLGVIIEVSLCIHICVVTDDLDGVLVCSYCTVSSKSPEFTVKRRKHFTSGTIDARFLVEDGKIKDIKIYGDFFGSGDVKDVEDALRGLKYDVSTIKEALGKLDLNKYFVGIDAEDVKELISTQQ